MAKKETNIDALIIQNPELKASLLSFQNVKLQLSAEAKKLDLVEIKDDTSLMVLEQGMSKLKDLTDAVETSRVSLKAPYLEKGNAIDSAAKYVNTEPLESIKKAKDKKLAYIKQQANFKANYDTLVLWFSTSIELAVNAKMLSLMESQLNKIKGIEYYGTFTDTVIELKKNYLETISIKKNALILLENASPDEKEAIEESMAEAQEKIQETVSVASTMTFTAKKTRMTWKFELDDISKVKPDWLCLDEEAVRDWMNANKYGLKDGGVVNGVIFYQQQSVTV